MKDIKNLLVIIDPTVDRDFVVEKAKTIAEAYKPKVTFFINDIGFQGHDIYNFEGVSSRLFNSHYSQFVSHNQLILEKLAEEFTQLGVEVTHDFRQELYLAESILTKIKEVMPDLTIKSTHHHNRLRSVITTNTDWRLIRKCPTPLLLVKPYDWSDDGSIIAAVDPLHVKAGNMSLDHLLTTTAECLSRGLKQTAKVFHCYYPYVTSAFAEIIQSVELTNEVQNRHRDKVNELLSTHDIDPANVAIVKGDLIPSLKSYIEKANTNLLVMGALSRSIILRAVVGNTAEKILEDISCDILVIKDP